MKRLVIGIVIAAVICLMNLPSMAIAENQAGPIVDGADAVWNPDLSTSAELEEVMSRTPPKPAPLHASAVFTLNLELSTDLINSTRKVPPKPIVKYPSTVWAKNLVYPFGPVNQPPNVSFMYSPGEPIANQTIIFDASNSTDPDGTITNYEWDFGDGTTGFGKVTTHSYANNGTYNVILTVTDDDGATDTIAKEITIGGAEDQSGTPDQSSFRLYHSTIDDEIDIEIYGLFEPGLNTKVNYEVLITPTSQAGGPIHSGKVYFAYPDNNTNIYPIELWFKTCVDHNWYRIDMAEDFSRDEWINLGVDTLMSMGTGIPGLWELAKMLLGPSYPTPPEGTAYFDDNAYDSIVIPYHPIGRKVPNSLLSIGPGEGVRVVIPVEFTQRRTSDLHFFINTQILSEPICHHTRDIEIYINAGR